MQEENVSKLVFWTIPSEQEACVGDCGIDRKASRASNMLGDSELYAN